MSGAVDLIGFLASATAFGLFVPQAMLTWRKRRDAAALSGVSVGMQAVLLGNAVLWGAYGVLTGAFWVAAPGLVNGPLALATLLLVLRARRSGGEVSTGCGLCDLAVEHRVFITSPPGWGSVMPCSEVTRRHGVAVLDEQEAGRMRRAGRA